MKRRTFSAKERLNHLLDVQKVSRKINSGAFSHYNYTIHMTDIEETCHLKLTRYPPNVALLFPGFLLGLLLLFSL